MTQSPPEPETSSVEVVPAGSTRDLYEQALSELHVDEFKVAKEVIKQRILEVERLKRCLAKAEADLQKLLSKQPIEIALLYDGKF